MTDTVIYLVHLGQHLGSEGFNFPAEVRHVIRLCAQHYMRRP